jgi:hypothetical protein
LQISPAITVTPPPSGALGERIVGSLQKYFEELGYGFGYVVWIPWFVGHFAPRRLTPLRSSLLLFLALGTFHSMLIIWLEFTAGYLAHRHVMPIIVICAPAAGAGIELLGRMVGALTRHADWSPRFAFTIALILVAVAVPFATREINAVATPVVVAADWVRNVAQPGQTVLANSHYPRFYASLEGPIFGIDATDLNASLRDLRPDFVVLDVDSRLYAPPDADDLGTQYAPAFETRGAGERAWHHVVVYRRIRPNPADSGLRSAGHTGRR